MSTHRLGVFHAISGEREYQERKWNAQTTTSGGKHVLAEWILYMQDYLDEARKQLSRNPEPEASRLALHTVRKVTALGVACMEQLGAPERETP
jgi:hypothetical protein